VVNEVCMQRFETIRFARKPNPKTGLNELDLG
jgi:hypothetical protein